MLRHDPALDWQPRAAPARSPPPPPHRVVTFLFTDVVGSTERLDRLGETAAEKARQAALRPPP